MPIEKRLIAAWYLGIKVSIPSKTSKMINSVYKIISLSSIVILSQHHIILKKRGLMPPKITMKRRELCKVIFVNQLLVVI